ncbi:GDSL-like Lipase/Acylhydrolase [compost metagenome]
MIRAVFLFILTINSSTAFTQNTGTPLFPNGSKVCFVGNSITHNGEYYNNLWLYYATRFPKEKITFYNAGISGDVAGGVLKRIDTDILVHKPSHVVMMIGMNDVRRSLYGKGKDNDSLKRNALDFYKVNTEKTVGIFKEKIGNVILLKPSIYDQTATLETENFYGVNDALQTCGAHMSFLAAKYQTELVDFQSIMLKINLQRQKQDSSFTIVSKDRVHPLSAGHFVMTYQFLKDTKAPQYVSKISIGKDLGQSQKNSFNCKIEKLTSENNTLSFQCLEESLPFPVKEAANIALEWIPFQEEFNQQLFQVDNLTKGNYTVYIDDQLITTCSETELKKGINLALFSQTPQYKQAAEVMKVSNQYRNTESIIRNLRFVELNHLSGLTAQADLTVVEKHLADRLETLKNGGNYEYYHKQFKNYIEKKPSEDEILKKLSSMVNTIYKINQPQIHVFKIVKQ